MLKTPRPQGSARHEGPSTLPHTRRLGLAGLPATLGDESIFLPRKSCELVPGHELGGGDAFSWFLSLWARLRVIARTLGF